MPEATPPARFERYFHAGCLIACAIALVAAIWSVPYLPTNDGPQSVFTAHVENHYRDPGTIYERHFELQPALAARGFSLLYRPLLAAMRWDVALRVAWSVMALAWAGAFAWFTHALHPARRAVGLLGFVLALSWPLYMGFFSFVIATTVGLAVAAYWVRHRPLTTRARVVLSLCLLGSMTLHAFGAVISAMVVGVVALGGADRRQPKAEVIWLGATALPMAAVLAWVAGSRESLEKTPFSDALEWEPWSVQLRVLPRLAMPGPLWRGALVWALAVVALILFVRTRRERSREAGLFAMAVLLLIVGCVAPLHIPGWQFFGARFLPLGMAMALSLLPLERVATSRRRMVEGACAAAVLISLWLSGRLHGRLYDGCSDSLSGLWQPLARTQLQLPVAIEIYCGVEADRTRSEVPYLSPLLHAGALYAVAHGGSVPWVFQGTGAVHALRMRMPPPAPMPPMILWTLSMDPDLQRDDRLRRATMTEVAAWGMQYEDLVVFGTRPEDRQLFAKRGYRQDWQQGSLFIGTFEPCPLEISISVERGGEPVEVSYGAWGLRELASDVLPAARFQPGAASPVNAPALCGDLWVRVVSIVSGARCRQAREDGRMRVTATRPRTDVVCDLGM